MLHLVVGVSVIFSSIMHLLFSLSSWNLPLLFSLYSSHTSSGFLRWAMCEIVVHLDCTISGQLIYHLFMRFPFECYELWKNYSVDMRITATVNTLLSDCKCHLSGLYVCAIRVTVSVCCCVAVSWYYVVAYCSLCGNDALYRENQPLFSYLDMLFARCC